MASGGCHFAAVVSNKKAKPYYCPTKVESFFWVYVWGFGLLVIFGASYGHPFYLRLDSNIESQSSNNTYLNITKIFKKLFKKINIIESQNLIITST